jgi:hypothetical protein
MRIDMHHHYIALQKVRLRQIAQNHREIAKVL